MFKLTELCINVQLHCKIISLNIIWKYCIYLTIFLFQKQLIFFSMSHHNKSLNFSHAPSNHYPSLSENTLHEIQMQLMNKQELRLRYIQLMNDAQETLGRQEAIDLMKESELIWRKLSA